MTRIYYTREKIQKFDKGQSGICLKFNQHTDSLMHAFWNCEKIKKKWEDIGRWLSIHIDTKVEVWAEMLCYKQKTAGASLSNCLSNNSIFADV